MTEIEFKAFLKDEYDKLKGKTNNYVFSCDEKLIPTDEIIKSENKEFKDNEEKLLHTNLLPELVVGDLENGKIFLCTCNPGYNSNPSHTDYDDLGIIRDHVMNQLAQNNASFFWLLPKFIDTNGGKWWRSKFNQGNGHENSLVQNIIKRYKANNIEVTEEKVFSMLSRIIVDLELIPYHSKSKPVQLPQLSSTRKLLDYVHDVLLPNASNNNQIICFVRSIRDWGVSEKEKKDYIDVICCNEIDGKGNRNFTLNPNTNIGEFIIGHINKLTDSFSILLAEPSEN